MPLTVYSSYSQWIKKVLRNFSRGTKPKDLQNKTKLLPEREIQIIVFWGFEEGYHGQEESRPEIRPCPASNISRIICISSVQSPSHVRLFASWWTAGHQASLSFPDQLPKLAQTHVHWANDDQIIYTDSFKLQRCSKQSVVNITSCPQGFSTFSWPMSSYRWGIKGGVWKQVALPIFLSSVS